MSQSELCVYVAGNVDEANIVVAWLADREIAATIPDRHTTATLGLPTIIPGHVNVCVTQPEQLDQARALIAEHDQQIKDHLAKVGATGQVTVTCEKCGAVNTVSTKESGHVIECTECHEYIDVPDPSESN